MSLSDPILTPFYRMLTPPKPTYANDFEEDVRMSYGEIEDVEQIAGPEALSASKAERSNSNNSQWIVCPTWN